MTRRRQFVTSADALGQDPERTKHEYAVYLRSPEWEGKRRARLSLANYRCEVCNSSEHLEVHHRTYARRGRELIEDLIVLCGGCHDLFSRAGRLNAA